MRAHAWLLVTSALVVAGLAAASGGAASDAADPPPAPTPARGAAPWPAPPDPMRRTRMAGLRPERREFLAYHVHAHLDVFVNGKRVPVPAAIGIDIHDPGVQRGRLLDGSTAYGGIELCRRPCISPLHTHDNTGVIHTESASIRPNRLGQFFTEWAVRLDRLCVGGYCRPRASILVYVNGKLYGGNPRDILLTDKKQIAIVIGSKPAKIPTSYDFSNA